MDDDKLKLVSQRIEQLLGDATAEMERTKDLNLEVTLDSAYEKLKSMVDELSTPHDGDGTGQTPTN